MENKALVVSSSLDELPRVIEFVRQACLKAGLDDDTIFACELATDEACTNIIEHAYQGRQDGVIRVACQVSNTSFTVEFHDHGQPFDPDQVLPPNLSGDLADREIGGLGLHFMRRLMDEVRFEFDEQAGNTLVMTKRLVGGDRSQ